jgi:hypothetical protein
VSPFKTPLLLEYGDGRQWKLAQGFRYDTDRLAAGAIYVPAGFETDFASVPRFFWRLFPPTGPYGKAAVIHDYLYRKSGVPRDLADTIFYEAMEELGVGWFTRHTIYRAVRVFGGRAYQEKA